MGNHSVPPRPTGPDPIRLWIWPLLFLLLLVAYLATNLPAPEPAVRVVPYSEIKTMGSRVAARALGDALALLSDGGRITVLTVQGEKPLAGQGIAQALAAWASMLAMGGFGHSRIRDFILGGATKGIFRDLRLPVLISH